MNMWKQPSVLLILLNTSKGIRQQTNHCNLCVCLIVFNVPIIIPHLNLVTMLSTDFSSVSSISPPILTILTFMGKSAKDVSLVEHDVILFLPVRTLLLLLLAPCIVEIASISKFHRPHSLFACQALFGVYESIQA